jgi:anti-sigma factor RsiW
MIATGTKTRCRQVRNWLHKLMSRQIGSDAEWVQRHIAHCARCQLRFAAVGRVYLAISAVKCQPHRLDLLPRANTQAIGVLKHSLRTAQKAQQLKATRPEPKIFERAMPYRRAAANIAACAAILVLAKIGVFSSMSGFQARGQQVVRQYYVAQVGEDLADEVFPL